jgi:hypothetical protein
LYGTAELEGMQQCHRPVEVFLCRSVARCGEVHLSQLLAIRMLMLLCEATRRQHQQ